MISWNVIVENWKGLWRKWSQNIAMHGNTEDSYKNDGLNYSNRVPISQKSEVLIHLFYFFILYIVWVPRFKNCKPFTTVKRSRVLKKSHSHTLGYDVKRSREYVTFTAACVRPTGVNGRIILRRIFRKWDVGVWTRSSWLRVGTGGEHLWMR